MTKNFNFVGFLKKSVIISICIILAGIIATVFIGVKLDISFSGGSRFTYTYSGDIDSATVEQVLLDKVGIKSTVTLASDVAGSSQKLVISFAGDITKEINQDTITNLLKEAASSKEALTSSNESTSSTSSTTTSATTSSATTSSTTSSGATSSTEEITSETMVDTQTVITHVLVSSFPDNTFTLTEHNTVTPSLAGSFFVKAIFTVVLAGVLVIVYIGIRFRKIGGVSAGLSAFVALIHDVIIAFLACAIFGLRIDTSFLAVVITLFGYSLNNTIIIFDRVRENKKLYPALSVREQVNNSINQTLTRSIMTTLTTFTAIMAIVIVAELFGVTTLRSFAIPMALGIASGCYSSVFLSGPIWVKWCEYKGSIKSK